MFEYSKFVVFPAGSVVYYDVDYKGERYDKIELDYEIMTLYFYKSDSDSIFTDILSTIVYSRYEHNLTNNIIVYHEVIYENVKYDSVKLNLHDLSFKFFDAPQKKYVFS